jgi:hypothetical protein
MTGARELGVADREPPDLREKLDLQEGDRGDSPRAMALDPRKFGESLRSEDEPDEEVSVEEEGHRAGARRGVRPPWGRHSQDQRSA